MAGPGGAEEPAGDDDGVGQGDVGLDHRPAAFGADGELLEASVVPGVGPLDAPAGPGLSGGAAGADHRLAAELVEEVSSLGAVVAGVEVNRDPLWQTTAESALEAAELLQGRAQQRRVVPVRGGDHAAERDTGSVDQQRAFGALLASVHRRLPGDLAAARRLGDAAVDASGRSG